MMLRLNKYMAQCGVCSRRDADRLIEEGKVLVNGQRAQVGQTVEESDCVQVGDEILQGRGQRVVLAYYKPAGVVCTERDPHAEVKITDVIKYPVRVAYAGRLDKDSEGLLLLSNDGDLIDAMMRGANAHEKEYLVRVNKEITPVFLEKMANGVYLEELGITTRPCEIQKTGRDTFRIILTQGLNRQIRRMCRACGYHAFHLKRIRVVNVGLGQLKPGEYRELTAEETGALCRACGLDAGGAAGIKGNEMEC